MIVSFQVKIWFQNNRYKCKQKQKEDDRNCSRSRDDSDRKFHADSPGSSGNSLNLTANNSPDMQIKLEDPIHNLSNGENPDLKSIMGYSSDIKDPSQQGFPGFNTMYPYPVSAFPFYPNPMSYPTAATGAPQTVYHPHFQAWNFPDFSVAQCPEKKALPLGSSPLKNTHWVRFSFVILYFNFFIAKLWKWSRF